MKVLWEDYRALYARKRPGVHEPVGKAMALMVPRVAIDANLHANLLIRARATRLLRWLHHSRVDPRARIGGGLFLPHPLCLDVDATTSIGRDVALFHNTTLRGATIGDGARIFAGATIERCVVGAGATIGANVVVREDVPPGGRVVWGEGDAAGEGDAGGRRSAPGRASAPASRFDRSSRALALVRLQHRAPRLWRLWRRLLLAHGVDVGRDARIGAGLHLPRPLGVVVGRHAVLGRDVVLEERVTVTPTRTTFRDGEQVLHVGDRVRVGAGAGVFGALTVADDATIPPGAVITHTFTTPPPQGHPLATA